MLFHVDHGKVGKPPAEFAVLGFNKLLPLLGHVVLGVLA